MSTILKALRRLEQEKARTDRPLREQVTGLAPADRSDPRGSRRWPILLGGIGAGVGAGLAVLLLVLSRGDSPAPPSAAEPSPVVAERPAPQPAGPTQRRAQPPRARLAPAAARPAPVVASDDVEMLERGVPAPRVVEEPEEEARPAAPAEPAPGSVRPFQHAARRALPAATPSAEPPVTRPAPIAAPEPATPLPAPQVAKPATALPPPEVAKPSKALPPPEVAKPAKALPPPEAARAPARPRPAPDPFPALRVERTTWHPLAERRLAVVDVPGEGVRELREGDRVAGATVASIEPSGVVFRFDGRDVRRKIGGGS